MNLATQAADRVTSAVFFVLGVAMLAGGLTMDRLEIRQIHPASIPGLLPIFLGGTLAFCAVLLYLSSRSPSKDQTSAEPDTDSTEDLDSAEDMGSTRDLLVTGALSLVFAAILVGRVPFIVASAIYVSAFIAYFSWPVGGTGARKAKTAALSIVGGILVATTVSALFRYGFLVRLP